MKRMKRMEWGRSTKSAAFLALIVAADATYAQDIAPQTVAMMTLDERQAMTTEMQRVLDDALKSRPFIEDYPWKVEAIVSLDASENLVVVDFDARMVDYLSLSESEDMSDFVHNLLWDFLKKIDGHTGIKFLYGGKSAQDAQGPAAHVMPNMRSRLKRDVSAQPSVVISPGHGLYFHGKYKDWRTQREPANGILEDDLTPLLAGHLAYALRRDGIRVETLRAESPTAEHGASKQPWWRLAARYQLESRFPMPADVWQSESGKPLTTDKKLALKERDEDIRSRPLYANHIGADAIIHVHTNAHSSPSATGFRVYVNGREEDKRLASNVLCSARELISTSDEFKSHGIAATPSIHSAHAENNLARMPSVIVEVGFHTNSQDATFLKNREFQALAMRGVAKGYRLFRSKRPCEDFAVDPVEQVTGRVGVDVRIPFSFKGNPVYPIRVWSKDEKCTGRGCHDRDKTLAGPSDLERFNVQFLCKREDVERSPIEVTVGARDSDKVSAKTATYKIVCTR